MKCPNCGNENEGVVKFCRHCGKPMCVVAPQSPQPQPQPVMQPQPVQTQSSTQGVPPILSPVPPMGGQGPYMGGRPNGGAGVVPAYPKQKLVALLLCLFLGALGVHRIYVGRTGSGILMLVVTLLGSFLAGVPSVLMGLWALVDLIRIAIGSFTDVNGAPLV